MQEYTEDRHPRQSPPARFRPPRRVGLALFSHAESRRRRERSAPVALGPTRSMVRRSSRAAPACVGFVRDDSRSELVRSPFLRPLLRTAHESCEDRTRNLIHRLIPISKDLRCEPQPSSKSNVGLPLGTCTRSVRRRHPERSGRTDADPRPSFWTATDHPSKHPTCTFSSFLRLCVSACVSSQQGTDLTAGSRDHCST
jgi:hypothetical protein